jgi:N-acetylglutamate synthase-like GNAT family acetyltransferase
MDIRFAERKDSLNIVKLVNSAYRGEDALKGWTTEAEILDGQRIDEEMYLEMLQKENSKILVMLDKDQIVACISVEKQGDTAYIGMVTVSPLKQNSGLGSIILKAAEDFARSEEAWNCKVAKMTVISCRKSLIEYYKRRGYINTEKTEPFPSETKFGIPKMPLEFFVMNKKLI